MKNIILILLLFCCKTAYSQIRAFDNSKAILPWIYNPSVDLNEDLQVYLGYDGRGNSEFTPQSVLAGIRIPVLRGGKNRMEEGKSRGKGLQTVKSMIGAQVLNTSQDLLSDLNVQVNFAQLVSISERFQLALGLGAGINHQRYEYDALNYLDQQDVLLINAQNSTGFHLNAGLSVVMDNRLFINLAAPYLLKNGGNNIDEIILRAGYDFPINQDVKLIAAGSLDTQNRDLIYGADIKVEIRKMVSILAGADRRQFFGGLLLNFKPISLGYTYGQNFESVLNNINSHQISLISGISRR